MKVFISPKFRAALSMLSQTTSCLPRVTTAYLGSRQWATTACLGQRALSIAGSLQQHEHAVLYKPDGVLSQFVWRGKQAMKRRQRLLSDLPCAALLPPGMMAIGRLDQDTEGLMLLTTDGLLTYFVLKARQIEKEYYAQVQGEIGRDAVDRLAAGGMEIADRSAEGGLHLTRPCAAMRIDEPPLLPERSKPVAGLFKKKLDGTVMALPSSWISLSLVEGKNRQVRRMTAAVGHPTLRLVRVRVGDVVIGTLRPGELMPWDPGEALIRRAHEFSQSRRAEL